MSKLTMIGFHNYLQNLNDNLFSKMMLPSGIDADVLVNNILLRGGEFEVLYSNPYFMQDAIGVWSAKNQRTFERWVKALNIDYDPLYNYDRTEEWTDTGSGSSTGSAQTETEGKVSAYNSSVYQPDNIGTGSTSDEGSFENESTHKGRMYGNIGVTTSQQMLEAELDIAKWNIIDQITDLFLNEFVIPVY